MTEHEALARIEAALIRPEFEDQTKPASLEELVEWVERELEAKAQFWASYQKAAQDLAASREAGTRAQGLREATENLYEWAKHQLRQAEALSVLGKSIASDYDRVDWIEFCADRIKALAESGAHEGGEMRYHAYYEADTPPTPHTQGNTTFMMGKGKQVEILASDLNTARTLADMTTPEGHTLIKVDWTPESWTDGLVIDHIAGLTPVQGEGNVNGLPFYFRARGQHYSFSVAATPEADPVAVGYGEREPGYTVRHPWGDEPFAAGFMPFEVAERLVNECARIYLALPHETSEADE